MKQISEQPIRSEWRDGHLIELFSYRDHAARRYHQVGHGFRISNLASGIVAVGSANDIRMAAEMADETLVDLIEVKL